jgi:SPP1 family predicted phage head-tail adaptor
MPKACQKNPVAKMQHRLTVQTKSNVSDGQGGYTESWADSFDIWASIEPLKGWEKYQAMQVETPLTHKIIARYRAGITTAHRLKFGTRILHIKEVINENEAKAFLRIMAQEV